MLSFGPVALVAPWMLLGLIALPVIWWLLRVTPPSPRRVPFHPVRLLYGLRGDEEMPAKMQLWLALLRLLVDRGHASHEAVMDGSCYHACARGYELGSDTPAMKQALQDWFKIEAHAGSYRFDPAVVSNA